MLRCAANVQRATLQFAPLQVPRYRDSCTLPAHAKSVPVSCILPTTLFNAGQAKRRATRQTTVDSPMCTLDTTAAASTRSKRKAAGPVAATSQPQKRAACVRSPIAPKKKRAKAGRIGELC